MVKLMLIFFINISQLKSPDLRKSPNQFKRQGPRFTIMLKVKDYLNFKMESFTLRKSYSESQFLRYPAENVHGVVKKEVSIDFVCASFCFTHEIFNLKLL